MKLNFISFYCDVLIFFRLIFFFIFFVFHFFHFISFFSFHFDLLYVMVFSMFFTIVLIFFSFHIGEINIPFFSLHTLYQRFIIHLHFDLFFISISLCFNLATFHSGYVIPVNIPQPCPCPRQSEFPLECDKPFCPSFGRYSLG